MLTAMFDSGPGWTNTHNLINGKLHEENEENRMKINTVGRTGWYLGHR